jgi:eukaryotic-like serine/threonine-protein kinase
MIGESLGPYRIVGELGAGGMGEVYRARDARLNRDVAIKILPEAFAHEPERLTRFTREAQTLAALNHPNIAQIYGVEESPSVRAIVMELVDGEDLFARIARGPISVAETLPLVRQIVDALEAAHEHGIIHRDLKPGNVKVTADGRVKVLDFGLAKLAPDFAASPAGSDTLDAPTITTPATLAGTILGTTAYMAPEQARGRIADKRADIWAFGVIRYEMLTGRRTFAGASTTDVLAAVIKDDPDWTALPADVPPSIKRLLARCLTKDPKYRLRDIGDARFELDQADVHPTEQTDQRGRRSMPLWTVGAGVAATVAIGAALLTALRSQPAAPGAPRRASIQVSGLGGYSRAFAYPVTLSADGSLLVSATAGRGAGGPLYARHLDTLVSRQIEGTTGAGCPFLSRDGRIVGFEREGEIFSVPLAGGPVVHAKGSVHLSQGCPAWMPDGRIVFTNPAGGLVVVNADGSSARQLTTPSGGERHVSPNPLPDGRAVLFTSQGADPNDARVAAASLADGAVRTLVEGGATAQYADGFVVYARPDGRLMAVPFDPERLEISGAAQALPDRVNRTRFGVGFFSVAEGLIVYLSPAMTRLVEIDRTGKIETLETDALWHHPRYSPDGARIAVDVTDAEGARDVWVYDRAAKTLSRVTRIGDAHDPSWLPDGRSISFFSLTSGPSPLLVVPADGASEPKPVPVSGGFPAADLVNPGGWTPDGSAYVGGVETRGAPGDLWLLPRSNRAPVKIVGSSADEVAPSISPDGKWLAYQSDETGRGEIYVRALDGRGGRVQVSNVGGTEPVWDRTGTILYYVESDGLRSRLMAASLRTSPTLATLDRSVLFAEVRFEEADNHPNYDLHPDGSRFVMPALEAPSGLVAVFDWAASFSANRNQ